MSEIGYFVPGEPAGDEDVLAHLRWPIPANVARTYVQAYTEPGQVVLVPYCQGPAAVREILAAGRRALALNFDPALVLLVETALAPRPRRELDAAVARLGDSLKQGLPLRRYLGRLYATTCPACLRPAVADYFVWDRDQMQPVAKHLRCPACAWDGRTGIDAEDRERLAEVPARGMHYHYVLDRLAPQSQKRRPPRPPGVSAGAVLAAQPLRPGRAHPQDREPLSRRTAAPGAQGPAPRLPGSLLVADAPARQHGAAPGTVPAQPLPGAQRVARFRGGGDPLPG